MLLELQEIFFEYGGGSGPVINGLTLELDSGETVALVGPSGSGKSTLLALIGGLLRPTRGLRLFEPPPNAGRPRIRWVPQTVNTLRRRSVLDNVAIAGFADGLTRRGSESEARSVLEHVGLATLADRKARTLSGGELQRLVVARALFGQPALILADEPTGQLDAHNTQVVARALLQPRSPNTTVVVATHDLSVAAMCGRTIEVAHLRAEA